LLKESNVRKIFTLCCCCNRTTHLTTRKGIISSPDYILRLSKQGISSKLWDFFLFSFIFSFFFFFCKASGQQGFKDSSSFSPQTRFIKRFAVFPVGRALALPAWTAETLV